MNSKSNIIIYVIAFGICDKSARHYRSKQLDCAASLVWLGHLYIMMPYELSVLCLLLSPVSLNWERCFRESRGQSLDASTPHMFFMHRIILCTRVGRLTEINAF